MINIAIEKIKPHPNNPRKDLGNITDLASSIAKSGMLQSITVTPEDPARYISLKKSGHKYKGNFFVIIGHRRLAAAKEAGIEILSCTVVSDMDENTQIAVMLSENIHREKLTPIEKAESLQLMLDIGNETPISLSERISKSKSFVDTHLTVTKKFSKKTLQEVNANNREITLTDIQRLYKIKDETTRNNLLTEIGTSDFEWNLKKILDEQSNAENRATIKANATPSEELPTNQPIQDEKKDTKEKESQKKLNEERLHARHKQAYEMRMRFIKNFKVSNATTHYRNTMIIYALLSKNMMSDDILRDIFEEKMPFRQPWQTSGKTRKEFISEIMNKYNNDNSGIDLQLIGAYCMLETTIPARIVTAPECLPRLYELLSALGYRVSTEEQQLSDGTHPLYIAVK